MEIVPSTFAELLVFKLVLYEIEMSPFVRALSSNVFPVMLTDLLGIRLLITIIELSYKASCYLGMSRAVLLSLFGV